jgi:hypothetical protein
VTTLAGQDGVAGAVPTLGTFSSGTFSWWRRFKFVPLSNCFVTARALRVALYFAMMELFLYRLGSS